MNKRMKENAMYGARRAAVAAADECDLLHPDARDAGARPARGREAPAAVQGDAHV